jgi:hypothetical protein
LTGNRVNLLNNKQKENKSNINWNVPWNLNKNIENIVYNNKTLEKHKFSQNKNLEKILFELKKNKANKENINQIKLLICDLKKMSLEDYYNKLKPEIKFKLINEKIPNNIQCGIALNVQNIYKFN